MRLIVSTAVLAIWMAETPSGIVDAFSMKGKPRFRSRPRYSGLSAPSSLYMSTIERPMTAPNSPNSAGHPFGAYGKPPQDGNRDDSAYSYGPRTPRDSSSGNDAPADSFEAYMRERNRNSEAATNPPSPSDNYFDRQQSAPTSNFGAPSTPANNRSADNNFGAPSSPSTPPASNDSYSSFGSRGNVSTPPPPANNFGTPSTPQTPTPPPLVNNFGAPQTPAPESSNNSISSFANGGNASTIQPAVPPAPSSFEDYMNSQRNRSSNQPNSAPSGNSSSAAPSSSGNNNANSFANFATGSHNSSSQPQALSTTNSFEDYMNSQRKSGSSESNSPPSGNSSSSPFSSTNSQSRIASTVAAAADPNSPLPPYMSPASLEDANVKSANVPGSPSTGIGRPDFMPPMPGMSNQQAASTAAAQTTFREQDNSMRNQIAPPITAPLARTGTPVGQLDIGTPSQELVGRLDQVLNKQREFEVRLDHVDQKIDRTTQENIERTQSMLNEFREDNKKTQETFMNRINTEVHGMKSTMDKVLNEQRELKQKQENQTANFANLERSRSEQAEKLLTLEKTTSIRAQNLERNANQAAVNSSQRLEALERNAGAGQEVNTSDFQLEHLQNERMAAFEQTQLERMAAFEESQRQQLEDSLRVHREASQQYQNTNNPSGGTNSPHTMNSPEYLRERERMDDTEQRLQERLEEAQRRKEELLQQLQEMQEQEEMYRGNGNGPSTPPPPPPYANPLDQQQKFQPHLSPPGSPSQFNANGPQQGSPSQFDRVQERDGFDPSRQPRFEDEEEDDEEQPRRNMLRDRLGKASGEELYQPNGVGRRGAASMDNFDDENDYDDRVDQRMRDVDPEEERRLQHDRMMRRDPISPPVAMGPGSQRVQKRQPPGSPAGRYDPRRGGPSDDMMEDELAYGIADDRGMHKTLSNMRSFKGDEQLPNQSLFDKSGAMGGAMGMDRRGSTQQRGRRVPANQGDRGMRDQRQPPQQRPGPKQRRAGLSEGPPQNPAVDRKIEHFLVETLKNGPKPHFDKEMESLLMIKYSPLFSWLKPANVSFLRNVLITYLQHKGCQVEMDLKNASPKAAQEWGELLNILSFELKQRTGEEPRIMEEPGNQWGIYGSKNVRLKVSASSGGKSRVSTEEAARRKRRNDKAFIVSTDPTDPKSRLL